MPTTNLYVVHDDLDIKLGEYKIQKGKGPKDHNGLLSIENALGTKDFWRVRIGIENRRKIPNSKFQIQKGEDYVLQNFFKDELLIINQVIDDVVQRFTEIYGKL
jgi:PTH1 family peptidyl-tRNA hydrolase